MFFCTRLILTYLYYIFYKKCIKSAILIFVFFTSINLSYSQNNTIISDEIQKLSVKNDKGANDSFTIGKEMLRISKNDCEKSKAYLRLGDAKSKSLQYIEAISYLKKVDSLAPGCNLLEDQVSANFLLMMIYIDLKNTPFYHKSWKKIIDICKLIKDPSVEFLLMQVNAIGYETDDNYPQAVIYRKKISNYAEDLYKKEGNTDNQLFLAMTYSLLSYSYFKNNQIPDAEIYLNKSFDLMKDIPEERNYILQKQYLVKAMLFAEKKNNQQAIIWFDKALIVAKQKKQINSILNIYEERLNYGLDNIEKRRNITDEIKRINQDKLKLSSDYSNSLIREKEIERYKLRDKLVISVSFLILIILVFFFYNRNRNKKIQQKFEIIIENLRLAEESNKGISTSIIETRQPESMSEVPQKIMSDDKEEELLNKLNDFENSTFFTEKGFTMSKMESRLSSNRRYINYILQKNKNKNFTDYIQGLRIKYIVEKLVNNPEYLNYKISHLAELSGFSNHSRFTQIFKKELEISPSEFINQLLKKNK